MFTIRLSTLLTLAACIMTLLPDAAATADGHNEKSAGVVLITGANRGIGLEFARQYAADGWTVIGTARSPEKADELRETGARIEALDVVDADSVAALVESLDGQSIDLLINNAGIFPRENSLANVDFDDYEMTLLVNTVGPVRVTQALLPNLQSGEQKKIVNITSGLGSISNNSGGYYGYRESTAALNMFTTTLAKELGPEGFICLTIHPGWVATDMGGPNANLSPPESVSAMRAVIKSMTPADNGAYRSYDGEPVEW